MNGLRRIDVLLNEKTFERFDTGDIVTVKTRGTYGRELTGRIDWIETLELTLDMSEKYEYRKEKIKYEEINSIRKEE